MSIAKALNDVNRPKTKNRAQFATVIDVNENGVKIRVDGEDEERPTYYNSIANVNPTDRVYINYVSGSIIIIGKLLYTKG